MKARDVMTPEVVSVRPDTPTQQVARLLLKAGISACPVVDEAGVPVGMVSEGDLIGRGEAEREARRDWWLALLAEGEALNENFVASLHAPERRARDVMSGPVVTVTEDTEVAEIARLLAEYRIKRVPVVRGGRLVGIVSRADLLRALAPEQVRRATPRRESFLAGALTGLDEHFGHHRQDGPPRPAEPRAQSKDVAVTVREFRNLVADFEREQQRRQEAVGRAAEEQRRQQMAALIGEHISEEGWERLLERARQAAAHGEKEFLLLRFPSPLCGDGGRAVNGAEPGWPATLRGEPAEIYLRWARDLKPRGFHLAARVLDFPDGKPGDIGLFLAWGE